MKLHLLEPAEQELDEAVVYYNAQVDSLGDAFLLEVLRVFNLIKQYPDAWHLLGPGIRRCRMMRFPYGVIYATDPEEIVILAIAHMHRRPGYWRDRLTTKR